MAHLLQIMHYLNDSGFAQWIFVVLALVFAYYLAWSIWHE